MTASRDLGAETTAVNAMGAIAVAIGGALGAWSRWGLSYLLNTLWPSLPPGTLSANLVGGYLVGFFVELFSLRSEIPPEAALFVITGFLGEPRFRPFRPRPSHFLPADNTSGRSVTSPAIWPDRW